MTIYFDCNATTPIEPAVADHVLRFLTEEFGNAGSRTHGFGQAAKQAVQKARDQVGAVVGAKRDEVVFTSGATESNNIALLGLAAHGAKGSRRHIISTTIEHKAVLEPLAVLEKRGFEITYVPADQSGRVDATAVAAALRADTLLVSVMHVNNETGIVQPVAEIAEVLANHDAFFHVDAAQGFGKITDALEDRRIDLVSISGHKLYGPKGVGALIARRRGFRRPPLAPLLFGGGQERGLRPGTLPVPQVAGLGLACELARKHGARRKEACEALGRRLEKALSSFAPEFVGSNEHRLHNTLSVRFPGLDSEAAMLALKGILAVSNGSACTSASYEPSHVLLAMGYSEKEAQEAMRFSWCHMTEEPDWEAVRTALGRVL